MCVLRGCQGRGSHHIGPLCTVLPPYPYPLWPAIPYQLLAPASTLVLSGVPALPPFVSRFFVSFPSPEVLSLGTSFLHTDIISFVTSGVEKASPVACEIRELRSFIYINGTASVITLNGPLRLDALRRNTAWRESFKRAVDLAPSLLIADGTTAK